jgi:hypothetical protein
MWRLASSPISDAERLCGRDMFLTDQGSRRFLFDGFMTRWFDAFDPEATQADRGGSSTPTMVLFETRSLQLFSVKRGGIE